MGIIRLFITCMSIDLPRDPKHKRGLCRRAVSVRLSVWVSVAFVYCGETSRRINLKLFFTVWQRFAIS